jgi:hypothetical protein
MAKTLFEALNEGQQESQVANAPKLEDNTQAAQSLLSTKLTGKAAAPASGPGISSQAEKLGITQGQEQVKKAGLTQQLQTSGQAAQAEAQQQKFDIQESEGLDRIKEMSADFERRSSSILDDFERGQKVVGDQKDALALEIMGHQARLANQDYLFKLDQESQKLGMENEIKYKEEMARTILQDNLDFLKDDLAHRRFIDGSENDFLREMGTMDINTAMAAANQQLKSANSQAQAQGIGGLVTGTAQAYSTYNKDKDT